MNRIKFYLSILRGFQLSNILIGIIVFIIGFRCSVKEDSSNNIG